MNEEIKRLIEGEAKIFVKNTPNTCSNFVEYGFTKGAEFGYNLCISKWQEAERWRKVEEEPTNQDIVLVKTEKGCFATAYYHGKNSGWIVYGDEAYKQFGNIIEWKPIS